jgi:hypothetical protein
VMSIRSLFVRFEGALAGWPDTILSVGLIASGIALILLGLFGPRWLKLFVAAWVWFP